MMSDQDAHIGEKEWITVERTASYVEAVLIQQILESIGCPTRVTAPVIHQVFPFNYDPNWYQIQVPPDWEAEARETLDDYRKGGTPVQTAIHATPEE